MGRNSYDDSENPWNEDDSASMWDSDDSDDLKDDSKSINLNLNINPKFAAKKVFASVGAAALTAIVGAVLSGVFGGDDQPATPAPIVINSTTTETVSVDLFKEPKSMESFTKNVLASTVLINCNYGTGSGWVIDLSDDASTSEDDAYFTEIVTNNHVVEKACSDGEIEFITESGDRYSAYVYSVDPVNDLAILMTDVFLPALPTVQDGNEPKRNHWVMVVGSPGVGDDVNKNATSRGFISNVSANNITTDATINPGNSGGPMINSVGQVVATVTAKWVEEGVDGIGIARLFELICIQLDGCTKKQILK